jgi:hypothetical protein
VQNDSLGYGNAHAQNYTVNTYNWSLCCNNSVNSSVVLNNSCNDITVVKLSGENNAHVETGNNSAYSVSACISSQNYKSIYCIYPHGSSCTFQYNCVMSMAGSEGSNNTNAHMGACGDYSQNVCCGFLNSAPSVPIPNYPVNATNISERRPVFNWTGSTDPDSDPITYTVNATCGSSCRCSSFSATVSITNYTPTSDLCVDVPYNWTVSACDSYNACNTSGLYVFNITSVLDFTLIVNVTDFGSLALGQSRQTNASIGALVGQNNGNILLNGSINASSLFRSIAMNSNNFMYNASSNQTGSILIYCSQTSMTPMDVDFKNLFCNLSYSSTARQVKIDLNVTVPLNEQPGTKTSNIFINVVSGE